MTAQKVYQQICNAVAKYKLSSYVRLELIDGKIMFEIDQVKLIQTQDIDGCYALTTDLTKDECEMNKVHSIYKDLAKLESGFKLMKSSLEIRPMWHRLAKRTVGHVVATMLSLTILEEFERRIKGLNISVKAAIEALNSIQLIEVQIGKEKIYKLPDSLRTTQISILEALQIKLPKKIKKTA